jgi:outer membrane lipoprotein-sorting protein
VIALLAVLLVVQETPADFLKKVEDKYASAKSLSVSAEVQISGKQEGRDIKGKMEVTFRSKGEGKVRAELSGVMNDKPVPQTMNVSDGKALAAMTGMERPQKKEHALALGTWSRRFLVRTGLLGSTSSLFAAVFQSQTVKLEDLFKVSEVTDGGWEKYEGRERRVIKFTVASPEPGSPPMKCRVWVDHKNLTVLKRESTQSTPTGSVTITETYGDAVLDGEISDDDFKVGD